MAALTVLLLAASLAGAAEAPPKAIKVLTFNAAGIPLVHPGVARRMKAAGREIAAGGYDVVGLQELWRDGDSAALAREAGLPHAARFPRRVAFRSGLTILSRWPILAAEERAFGTVRPSLRHLFQGETVPSKGFLFARVATPWGELDFYAAHTLADYRETRYRMLRMTELFELAEGVVELSQDRPFVILGDLNSGHGDREFDLFLDLLGLDDPCAPAGKEACGDPRRPKRIDHVLLPTGRLDAKARLVFDPALSDHFGFAADLPRGLMALRARPDPERRRAALRAVDEETSAAIARLETEGRRAAWIPLYGAFLTARYARQAGRLKALRERAASAP
ncbi:MAG: endonuclease/exonuclease/phosphatase family protein [Elusimicrobia bacterium]|nr:endonuclease/exonuclease/phosphatase family protein [Elusimicrobiota bacterium]